MPRTIKCTNPSCGALINVPDGAMQVICGHCHTWHFPSDESSLDESESSSREPDLGYEAPPSSPVANADEHDFFNPVPPAVPHTDNFSTQDTPHNEQVPLPEAPLTVGYLKTDTGVKLELKEGINVIGRKNADLIIEDRTVSRRHCAIEINHSDQGRLEYFIYDIGHMEGTSSTNGVFVSGRSLRLQDYERIPIYHGTSFRIGKIELVLQTL